MSQSTDNSQDVPAWQICEQIVEDRERSTKDILWRVIAWGSRV